MKEGFLTEKRIEPINILIVFLIGVAAILFTVATIRTFSLEEDFRIFIFIAVGVVYLIVLFAFLKPKHITKILPKQDVIIKTVEVEKPIVQEVVKEIEKEVVKEVVKPIIKEVVKEVKEPVLVEVKKKEPKKTKYVGSSYNEKYHLRSCRFAGAIKPEYLIEEDDPKYFKLRGYIPCNVCNPDKK